MTTDPTKILKLLVDVRTACEMLGGLSARWLWTATKDGRIAHVKCGRRVMYHVDDLKRFVEANKIGGAQ